MENETVDRKILIQNFFSLYEAEYPSISNIIKVSASLIILGILLITIFQASIEHSIVFGFILVTTGLVLFAVWMRPYFRDKRIFAARPTVEQMNNLFMDDLHQIVKNKAIADMNLPENKLQDENFVIIPYPVYWKDSGVDDKLIMQRETVYTVWNVQIVALTEFYISIYYCTFDWFNAKVLNVKSDEFFYDDIASIKEHSVNFDNILIDTKEDKVGKLKAIKINNISGDFLSIVIGSSLDASVDISVNPNNLIQAIRIMLRNRRYNEVRGEKPEEQIVEQTEEINVEDSENELTDEVVSEETADEKEEDKHEEDSGNKESGNKDIFHQSR